jgi:hypothetical protein
VDGDGHAATSRRFAQEGGFSMVGFDEMEVDAGSDRQDESGEASATAEVYGSGDLRWQEWGELESILDMAIPNQIDILFGHKVDGFGPGGEQVGVRFEACACFT